ncbi:hypothetical protein HPB47_019872 [Ixodes persulcatus]|uniref:Uncharacterized protein n=1 Tax=Ixodes persulcatus TaxID=34615 RepID=A0AC60QJ72_IXOPE|nr:hypothetical protein HPB47_019872 [Ixodes persulcatus]
MPPQLRKRPKPIMTAAQELRRYASSLQRGCQGVSTLKDIISLLSSISGYARLSQFFAPCTKSDSQPCHLLDQFSVWSRFLLASDMELLETAPETLSLLCLPYRHSSGRPENYGPVECILLHWLLKEHCCITHVKLPRIAMYPRFPWNVCFDALRLNSGLQELTIDCTMSREQLPMVILALSSLTDLQELDLELLTLSEDVAVPLATAIMRMPFLRSLSFGRLTINPGGSAEHLGTALKVTSVLTSLMLNCSSVDPSDAKHLLQSLGSSIAELSVSGHFLQPGEGVVLANYVAENITLKKLRIEGCGSSKMTDLDNFFKGLQLNNSLEELCLNGFSLAKPAMESLAESVAMHRSLKLLEVWDNGDVDGAPLAELVGRNTGLRELRFSASLVKSYDAFADAVRKNTTLEKLSLNLVQHENVDVRVYRRFLEALSCNKSLQRVTLRNICNCLETAFCHILHETGTEARVDFDTDKYEAPDLAGVLSYPEPFNLRYLCIWSEVPTLSALQQLVNFHQLRELSMYLGDDLVEGHAATCIALFLASTKTLREATFVFTTTEESTHTLLKGISHNRSISELSMGRWSFGTAEMDLVHQIIKANTVLRSLSICPRDYKKSPLLELLPKYLLDNDHLLRVHMGPVLANYPVTQQLQEVARRNLSRLYRAVLFVTGSRGRRYADAFDRVCASPTLIKEVMKYASESEEAATQRVRSCKTYLDQHFWVEVGVVRGAVVCANSDGGVQLDQIGLDNWLCIRQFLKVADIREPPAQAAAACRPRKRHYHSR